MGKLQWIKGCLRALGKKDTYMLSLERVCVISPHIDSDTTEDSCHTRSTSRPWDVCTHQFSRPTLLELKSHRWLVAG